MFSFWLFFFEGHKDSVTCAGFSHDSTLVATGDMSGLLKVWQVDTKEEVWSFEAGDLEVIRVDSTQGPWLVVGESLGLRLHLYQTKPSLSQCTLKVQQEYLCLLPRSRGSLVGLRRQVPRWDGVMGLPADSSSPSSGWSGTLGHRSYWRALLMATPGCGRSPMVTARPSRVPTAQPPVAESFLMVR